MTLNELIEELQDIAAQNEEAGEMEVYGAIQPNYPIAVEVDTVTVDHTGKEPIVWIATGSSPYNINPYAPKHAWEGGEVFAHEDDDE